MTKFREPFRTEAIGFGIYAAGGWQGQHRTAIEFPTKEEAPIVHLFDALDALVPLYKEDRVMRPALAGLITSAERLLDGDLGRMDGGTLWRVLADYAQEIGYSMDHGAFLDELADTSDSGFVNQDADVDAIVAELNAANPWKTGR
jgi:hypothetical protein